jgi:putative isomerase
MSGFDNDIVTNIFPHQTIISADLSSWMVLEYRSAYHIAKILGLEKLQALYKEKALKLSQLINDKLWNEEMDSYSAYNLVSQKQMLSYKDPYLDSSIGLYAFQSCSNIIPLYARIADNDKASRMIEKYIINENHFASPFGIRSLSKASEYYNNAKWGNPPRFGDPNRLTNSNWQGPVWIPLNYFMYHAISYYGFEDEAKALADKTMKVLAKSIDSIGSFAENYNADSGDPLYATKFASWNILADTMSKDFSGQRWCMLPVFENMD